MVMASLGARAYMGVWGFAPASGVKGQSPWIGGLGGDAR